MNGDLGQFRKRLRIAGLFEQVSAQRQLRLDLVAHPKRGNCLLDGEARPAQARLRRANAAQDHFAPQLYGPVFAPIVPMAVDVPSDRVHTAPSSCA
ncbi:MAG TPA: hypothetical protein VE403_01540, partial [Sphingomicrobium sp.]|nr:hypothetical protein [Sphingomicrobium sp.]